MSKTETTSVTQELFESWALDSGGPVALYLRQPLLAVEAKDASDQPVIYPPTYADIGYNIDTLADGTRVALIDSVGSQANRMEPLFKAAPGEEPLVPQIEVVLHTDKKSQHQEKRSLLDLAHRSADAVVQSCPTLAPSVAAAFQALQRTGDAGPLCALAPTSLVFGVWDSRGETGEKRPRLVRSVIRAWDVEPMQAAAQFNSVWKSLDEQQKDELTKEAKARKTKLSVKGFADAPAVFRTDKVKKFVDDAPNPAARVLGGVLAKGRIERDVTVNLIALRGIRGSSDGDTKEIRRYLLALALLAATTDVDLFLREGCHLRYAGSDEWWSVPRRGQPTAVDLGSDAARELFRSAALRGAKYLAPKWPTTLEHTFDLKEAKKLLAKKDEEASTDV